MRELVTSLIVQHGGVLRRKKKHEVWQFPNGRVFVRAATPSDHRADANNLSDLRKILGITPEPKMPGRPRPHKQRPTEPTPARTHAPTSAPTPIPRQRPSIPLGTFAVSFSKRIETTGDNTEREDLQQELDRVLWDQAMRGVKKIK